MYSRRSGEMKTRINHACYRCRRLYWSLATENHILTLINKMCAFADFEYIYAHNRNNHEQMYMVHFQSMSNKKGKYSSHLLPFWFCNTTLTCMTEPEEEKTSFSKIWLPSHYHWKKMTSRQLMWWQWDCDVHVPVCILT